MLNQALEIDHNASRVLLIETLSDKTRSIREKLGQLGGYEVEKLSKLDMAPAIVEIGSPSYLVLSVDSLIDMDLEPLTKINEERPIPIIVLAQQHSDGAAKNAVAAGVTSYIVDDVSTERLPVIFDVAVERFCKEQSMSAELQETKQKLADRKLIEKAKGILMDQNNIREAQAFKDIRRAAMNQGKTMVELSQRIISLAEALSS